MTAPLPGHQLKQILEAFDALRVPEGHRAELIGGEIVVSPTPSNFHNWIYGKLHRQFDRVCPDHLLVTNTTSVALPATSEIYVPDLLICPGEELLDARAWQVPAADVLLVAEITSPATVLRDRKNKRAGYARSQVPLYLFVDPLDGDGSLTLYSDPDGAKYRIAHRAPFGAKISVPKPFEVELDTSGFVRS